MRRPFVAGNWKMFTTSQKAVALARNVRDGLAARDSVRVALCPPFPYLNVVGEALRGSSIMLGAQNLYPEREGAYTGEVSPLMLLDVGCRWVILGHSERRHQLGESDDFINRKVKSALAAGLDVIFCLGETIGQRESNQTHTVLERQLSAGLEGVSADGLKRLTLAYEPVWAIGTGRNATPEQAEEAHVFLREQVARSWGGPAAEALVIQYGGSVKPENAASLMKQPNVDGALVGGASLDAQQFLAIVQAAASK
jgi:triosephosphate isomerase